MSDKERKDTKQATIYEIRRLVQKSGKDYTNKELLELLDMIAETKAAE